MTDENQTAGRKANGAIPPGQPDASTSDAEVRKTGKREQQTAGPDGPSAAEVGDFLKKQPD